MTTRVRVPLHQKSGGFVSIDAKATEGAVIGVNVWNVDGTLYVPAAAVTLDEGDPRTLWSLVVQIPANVQGVAVMAGTGFVRKSGSSFSASPITLADLPSGLGGVPYFIADGETYTVAADTQALFALPIELEGEASLVVDGALVEVN